MKKTLLFINAGHGGMDEHGRNLTFTEAGKQTKHTNGKTYHNGPWFYEGVFNRAIADEFILEATKRGYTCESMYHPIYDTHRLDRVKSANHKSVGKEALWISFHANAAGATTTPQNDAHGVCVFVYKRGTKTAENAEIICKSIEKVFDKWGSKRRAQLVHDKPLDETYYTSMPAMLFEVGFFDNPNNADLLINKDFRAEVITAMLNEIEKLYL